MFIRCNICYLFDVVKSIFEYCLPLLLPYRFGRFDHGQISLHRNIIGNGVSGTERMALRGFTVFASLFQHLGVNNLGGFLAEHIDVDASEEADAAAVSGDPISERRNLVFV